MSASPSHSWTSAFGRACGVLLDTIWRWLPLSRINPNVLTFMGLVVNTWAAILFGSATASTQRHLFFLAGLVIIFSGFFDLVDGQVARATNRVTRFGAFFDSVVDRYSDASQFLGLLVFYARGALSTRMAPVLWVIAALSTITVIHRMRYTWTRPQDPPQTAKAGQAA